ncbi:uncharacterized protein LOC111633953 [Centruroides sculpturatus]|uniref:uncharacterized protein LOC111633953 n=1 Tax=Centruroides sculpturatus TaxID=218467 RepID=UPI000C6E3A59|nr:uncharacterized protein LOC111633953 [Centruroides sculpturatus]
MILYPEIDYRTYPLCICYLLLFATHSATNATMQHRVVAGKALGGSTALNFYLFVRGNKRDYDNWAKNGATGWSWDKVFPYFLKVEDNRDYHIVRNGYRGIDGNVVIQTPPFHAPVTEGFLKAAKEIGFGIGDFNAEPQTVFQPQQGIINRGARWGTLQAYINPILIYDKHAYGVKFEHHGELYEAYAKQEVIVSAGVLNSPKLLMLSGIGPKNTLEKFNNPIVADLPVGRHLQEQLSTFNMVFGAKTFTYSSQRLTVAHYNEFLVNGTGPLTSLGEIDTIGFVNSKYNKDPDWPDIELL